MSGNSTRAEPLRLKAENAEDMAIISACLQDAILAVDDMAHVPARRGFAALVSRYRWEQDGQQSSPQRVLAGLRIEGVTSVREKNIRDSGAKFLELLAIRLDQTIDASVFTLVFAADGAIRVAAEFVEVYLEDVDDPWAARQRPGHPL